MPSSSRPARRRLLQLILLASLAVASRAPFLARADRFFDADEAVEGLMARHVLLHGEHPAFLWGQRYKGVPEVYVAAAVFALAGPSVVALKSATLLAFAGLVCVQFVLVERLFSKGVAWLSTVLLLLGPPSFVLWSLSANAEIVLTPLAGTVMCLGIDRWRRTESRGALMAAAAAAGFGLWVQQFIIYYIIAAALAILYGLPRRQVLVRTFVAPERMPPWLRWTTYLLGTIALAYAVLGVAAFVSGGFDLSAGGVTVGLHHPQKLWNISAMLIGLWMLARAGDLVAAHRSWRPVTASAMAAFLIGYAPAIAGRLTERGSAPIARADLASVLASVPTISHQIIPIVAGLRSPTTGWLGVPPWLALAVVAALLVSFAKLRGSRATPLFHALLFVAALIFVVSGAFVDAQSYRYLMPAYGALTVVLAFGVNQMFRRSRAAGIVLMAALVTLFGLEQIAWYRQLPRDTQSPALVACLDQAGITAAYADYWVSYKLDFLTGERLVVAPVNGVDRYPPYTEQVRAHPLAPTLTATIGGTCASAFSSAP